MYRNSYVAATFTTEGADGQWSTSSLWVGRLEEVLVVHIGIRRHVLPDVLWYRNMENEEQLPGHAGCTCAWLALPTRLSGS